MNNVGKKEMESIRKLESFVKSIELSPLEEDALMEIRDKYITAVKQRTAFARKLQWLGEKYPEISRECSEWYKEKFTWDGDV